MTPAEFCESVTHIVLWTRRDGGRYVHRDTGARGYSVRMGLDCGHVTRWAPLGGQLHGTRTRRP